MNPNINRETGEHVALLLGVAALGAAMAWAIALALLQNASIAAGIFPQPGEPVVSAVGYQSSPLWGAATTLQTLANVSGVGGALLLIAVAALEYTNEEADS